ncbi:MAG: YceI family protein [Candidatus Eremiobacteraeota bacterium]|nr:YceI family protein [Candidatus Eremiobacteraeota bacterium]
MNKFWITPLLLLALAGCAANPADNKPKASVTDATPMATSVARVEGKQYALTDESKVGFVGSKVTGSHTGEFKKVEGSIVVPDGDITKGQVNINIDMTSVEADAAKLTAHLRSPDFFDVENHPQANFTSTSITGSSPNFEVTGNLTLRGKTKEITFPATIAVADAAVVAQAEFSINRNDFDIKYPGKPDDLIRPEVVIKFDVKANPRS